MPSEALQSYVVTVGTATTDAVGMSADAQIATLQNLAPKNDAAAYAKEGYTYLIQREFPVASPGTALFELSTGSTGMQIDGYEIVSTIDSIKAELIEGGTATTTGTAVTAYNLNRNESDSYDATFTTASAVSGGTVVAAEYITADKHAAAGGRASGKIFTLKPNTDYVLKFVNKGNQNTTVFFQMTFSERFNGQTDIWLGGSPDNAIRLRGGETLSLRMIQGQTLAASSATDTTLAVLRQD